MTLAKLNEPPFKTLIRAKMSAIQTMVSTWERVKFDNTVFDELVEFDHINNRFTALKNMKINVSAQIEVGLSSSSPYVEFAVMKNATFRELYKAILTNPTFISVAPSLNGLIELNAGEYIECYANGITLTIHSTVGSSFFCIDER